MRRSRRSAGLPAAFLLIVVVVGGASGCRGRDAEAGAASADARPPAAVGRSTIVPPAATAPRPAPLSSPEHSTAERQVLDAVEGVFTSIFTVNDPPDIEHPDLATYRTGRFLQGTRELVESNRMLGIAYRLPEGSIYTHTARVESLDAERARVTACLVDDGVRLAMANGQVLNDVIATKLYDLQLLFDAGRWRVAAMSLVQRWEGVNRGCAGQF